MSVQLLLGDCRIILPTLAESSVHCVVTSPPYWGLRDYGVAGQLGLEPTAEAYLARMVEVFREVRRVLREDGTCWVNMGDGYAGSSQTGGSGKETITGGTRNQQITMHGGKRELGDLKPKDLVGMPWRLAFALQADGWYLRADIIWAKPNPMPESVTDRPTKAHEYVFLLTKAARYFYDADAVREPSADMRNGDPGPAWTKVTDPRAAGNRRYDHATAPATNGRNLRTVWTLPTEPTPDAHFATFPQALAARCIQAGSSERGCCAACGAPWVRDVERTPMVVARSDRTHALGRTRSSGTMLAPPSSTTVGWQPTCDHEGAPVPCTVLDPFAGTGTVGAVAEQLGRHSILIELSPTYVALAEARTAQLGLFAQECPT